MRLFGNDDKLTPAGHELGARTFKALSGVIEEYLNEGYSIREIQAVISQEIGLVFGHLLAAQARRNGR